MTPIRHAEVSYRTERVGYVGRIIEIALGFPTAIFTTLVLFSFGYWLIALAFGFADFDIDPDVDLDAGGVDGAGENGVADSDSNGSAVAAAFRGLGIHYLPIPLLVSCISLVGWLVSVLTTLTFTSVGGSLNVVFGLFVLLAALLFGLVVSGRIGRLLRPVFEEHPAIRRRDLIGRLCTIRTGRVDEDFGQAEVIDAENSTHLVQVRCSGTNGLAAGHQALIVDVDDEGLFIVSPDIAAIT